MPMGINITVDFFYIASGGGAGLLGQQQGDNPGQGQSQYPSTAQNAQTLRLYDRAIPVPGTEGSRTVANINTALTTAVADIAGASGTPIITAPILAQLNGWATGNP